MRYFILCGLTVALVCVAVGCKKQSDGAAAVDPRVAAAALYEQGKLVYLSRCIACHNADPKQDGALGPSVFGSSLELLEARVLRVEYPQGHTPKRTTKLMAAMPDVEKDLPAIHAYLNNIK